MVAAPISAYLRTVGRPARVFLYRKAEGRLSAPLEGEQVADLVLTLQRTRNLLLLFWNAHALMLLAGYTASTPIRALATGIAAVADDSLGGLITRGIYSQLGIHLWPLTYADPAGRLADVKRLLTDQPNIIMAADSHGPYRAVSSATVRLMRAYEGPVVLVSAAGYPSVRLNRTIGMRLPLPHATIRIGIEMPNIPSGAGTSLYAQRRVVQKCLESLEADLCRMTATDGD